MKVSDSLYALFVGHDDLRPPMKAPFLWNGYTVATDGTCMILVPGEDERYKANDINVSYAIPPRVQSRQLSIIALRATLDSIPLILEKVEEEVECDECDGDGFVECTKCGQDADCEKCDGTGKVKTQTKETGKMIPDEYAPIVIDGAAIRQGLLRRLLVVADELGVTVCDRVSDANPTRANEFEFAGGARVLLMPWRLDGSKTIYELKKTELAGA